MMGASRFHGRSMGAKQPMEDPWEPYWSPVRASTSQTAHGRPMGALLESRAGQHYDPERLVCIGR